MNVKKATLLFGMTAILATGFLFMAGAEKSHAAGAPENTAKTIEIKIDNFSFGPMTLTVAAGTTVTWINNDDVPHTVVSEDLKTFKSGALDAGDIVLCLHVHQAR